MFEMFEGDSADMGPRKFLLTSMGGWSEGPACTDPGPPSAWTEIWKSVFSETTGWILVKFETESYGTKPKGTKVSNEEDLQWKMTSKYET